ncbi:unnamed protein product [Closterium sp. NIES-65]|nr:unnamed protein product [Closterium sp. NIES-65]
MCAVRGGKAVIIRGVEDDDVRGTAAADPSMQATRMWSKQEITLCGHHTPPPRTELGPSSFTCCLLRHSLLSLVSYASSPSSPPPPPFFSLLPLLVPPTLSPGPSPLPLHPAPPQEDATPLRHALRYGTRQWGELERCSLLLAAALPSLFSAPPHDPLSSPSPSPLFSQEDATLLRHALRYGTRQWGALEKSSLLPHRDNKSCCNRFLFLKKSAACSPVPSFRIEVSLPPSALIKHITKTCSNPCLLEKSFTSLQLQAFYYSLHAAPIFPHLPAPALPLA